MGQPYNCRVIGILVSVGVGFFIVGFIIAISTSEEECGTHDGFQCRRNEAYCPKSRECQCLERRYGHLEYTCKDTELQWSVAADVFISIFGILFWCCIIASIVFCVCRCIHREDYGRSQNVVVIPVETFHQGGKL